MWETILRVQHNTEICSLHRNKYILVVCQPEHVTDVYLILNEKMFVFKRRVYQSPRWYNLSHQIPQTCWVFWISLFLRSILSIMDVQVVGIRTISSVTSSIQFHSFVRKSFDCKMWVFTAFRSSVGVLESCVHWMNGPQNVLSVRNTHPSILITAVCWSYIHIQLLIYSLYISQEWIHINIWFIPAIKGVESQCTSDFRPVLMKNVTYIAGAVVFNEKGEVLLMQEAKVSCAGTWYLPAGRVEPGEQIIVIFFYVFNILK